MGQSLSKVYVHIIFITKNRVRLIDNEIDTPKILRPYRATLCSNNLT